MPLSRRQALYAGAALVGAAAFATSCANTRRTRAAETSYPPIGAFVDAPGARIHLLDRPGPTPDAPAVVLIHGASGNLRDFAFDMVDRLTPRFRVIAVDRPGLGYSSRGAVEAPWRPDVQARLMRAAVKARGVERATIVGHSWGAAAALAWALDAPETVDGVVTLAGATHPFPGGVGWFYDVGAARVIGGAAARVAQAFLSEEGVKPAIARIFRPQSPPDGYIDYVGVGLALRADTLRANAEDLSNLKTFLDAQQPRYRDLQRPVEVLHGDQDRVVGLTIHAEPLAAEAPEARLTRMPGVGHMPHHADPEACVAAITRAAERGRGA